MEIVSTMGAGSLGRELDLHLLVDELENSSTSVDTSFVSDGMVTIYFDEDSPAYTLYRTGTFQIRGPKTESDLNQAESNLRTILSSIGVEMPDYEFRHATSVFVGSFEARVNLEKLIIALGLENTEYEPEQFPAVIFRPQEFGVTLLIFSTGKIVVGGTTDRKEAKSALKYIGEIIVKFNDV